MGGNIFENKDSKKQTEVSDKVDTHSKAILQVISRQKDLESTTDLLDEKIELLDHNSIKNFKSILNDIKSIKTTQREIKQELLGFKEFNSKITKQVKLMSTIDEVSKLEKYIDLWNPMNFVTQELLEKTQKKTKDDIKKMIEDFLINKK